MRRILPHKMIDVDQMLAKECVEGVFFNSMMIVSVPPEPVAALGDQKLFENLSALCFVKCCFDFFIRLARLINQLPRPVLLRMPDPDVEISPDPAAGFKCVECKLGNLFIIHTLRHRGCFAPRKLHQPVVKQLKKVIGIVRIVLPGIFAVEDHIDQRIFRTAFMNTLQPCDEILHRLVRIPAAVRKAHQITQRVVTEKERNGIFLKIESVSAVDRIFIMAFEGFVENLFIRRRPFDFMIGQDVEKLITHRTLCRPEACRFGSENFLIVGNCPLRLFHCIFMK